MQLSTGDKAILVGAAAIVVYEKRVQDHDDLISCRVAAYRRRFPVLTTSVVMVTALHLLDFLPNSVDPYHHLVKYFRGSR